MEINSMPAFLSCKQLPYMSPDLPGIGGTLKDEPECFRVEEIPLYEASGIGEHIYVSITRSAWTTRDLIRRLASLFQINARDIGYAGNKDKWATTTQTFSLPLRESDEVLVEKKIIDNTPFQVNWIKRHNNKLRVGHLLGNQFSIILQDPKSDSMNCSKKIAQALIDRGMPNFFGQQRFGEDERNIILAQEILNGAGPRDPWLRRFALSAFQSGLFNRWLVERIERGFFQQVLVGDIAKKTTTGALFEIEDLTQELLRFQEREITYTGPIYGKKMRRSNFEAGLHEQRILESMGLELQELGRYGLMGSRRTACLFLKDIEIDDDPLGLKFSFSLPKGSYATIVMREFMKLDE